MNITLRILVRKVEIYLEKRFGQNYINYKNKVPCVFPYGFLLKK